MHVWHDGTRRDEILKGNADAVYCALTGTWTKESSVARDNKGRSDLVERLRLPKKCFAMVLAGGRGSRLKQLTARRAKPAVYFGGKFRIVDFALSNCVNSNIRRIGMAT